MMPRNVPPLSTVESSRVSFSAHKINGEGRWEKVTKKSGREKWPKKWPRKVAEKKKIGHFGVVNYYYAKVAEVKFFGHESGRGTIFRPRKWPSFVFSAKSVVAV